MARIRRATFSSSRSSKERRHHVLWACWPPAGIGAALSLAAVTTDHSSSPPLRSALLGSAPLDRMGYSGQLWPGPVLSPCVKEPEKGAPIGSQHVRHLPQTGPCRTPDTKRQNSFPLHVYFRRMYVESRFYFIIIYNFHLSASAGEAFSFTPSRDPRLQAPRFRERSVITVRSDVVPIEVQTADCRS